jgi:hypothetical protein
MPDRFESNVFDPATTALNKAALEIALLKSSPSRTDEAMTRTLLASAIIDQINARSPKDRRKTLRLWRLLGISRANRRYVAAPSLHDRRIVTRCIGWRAGSPTLVFSTLRPSPGRSALLCLLFTDKCPGSPCWLFQRAPRFLFGAIVAYDPARGFLARRRPVG